MRARKKRFWKKIGYRKQDQARVAILGANNYQAPLKDVILCGIKLFGFNLTGKTVVLKPNLVEYDPAGVINTHPAVVGAAIEAFKSLGTKDVIVAEGPGHRRDNEYLLTASGLYDILQDLDTPYVDLNHDAIRRLKPQSHFTKLPSLYFPETVLQADLLVSMPKLKTHHWAGVTLSMKNLFGLMPGAVYGWPKNALHWVGIPNSIADINSTLAVPRFAIVDGIIGMEGNGPIQGDAKSCGVLIFGDDLVAVDATAARLMNMEPWKIKYLASVEPFLGHVAEEKILQIGESIQAFQQDFNVLPSFQRLKLR